MRSRMPDPEPRRTYPDGGSLTADCHGLALSCLSMQYPKFGEERGMSIRVITAAAAIALLVFTSSSAAQQRLVLFIATTGVDAGDCTSFPCRTCRYALTQIPFGSRGRVMFAPGVYSEPPDDSIVCNIFYHRVISMQGPLDDDGYCIDPAQTVIRLTKPGARAPSTSRTSLSRASDA